MKRTVSVGGVSQRLAQYLGAGVAVLVALVSGVVVLEVLLGVALFEEPLLLAGLAAVWVGLTVLWVRRARRWESSGSVWDAIPREQYTGRFAEAGGLARDSWERALPNDGEDDGQR